MKDRRDANAAPQGEWLEQLALDVCMAGVCDVSELDPAMRAEMLGDWVQAFELEGEAQAAALLDSPDLQNKVRETHAFLETTREELQDWQAPDAGQRQAADQRVVSRIIESLRAEAGDVDLRAGWRGDLQLVTRSFRARVSASPMLKLVAASLMVHLIALPAIAAYIIFAEPEKPLYITFDPSTVALPEMEEEVAPEEQLPDAVPVDGDLWSSLGLEVDNALAGARFALRNPGGLPAWEQRSDAFGEFWKLRLQRLSAPLAVTEFAPMPTGQPGVWQALALEILLDAQVLAPTPRVAWSPYTQPVWDWVQTEQNPWRRSLGLSVLVRAEAYGLFHGGKAFEDALAGLGPEGAELRSGARPYAPMDRAWLDLVATGLQAEASANGPAGNPAWRAWFELR